MPVGVLVSGDLVEHGTAREYAGRSGARAVGHVGLRPARHRDHRRTLRAAFPPADESLVGAEASYRYAAAVGASRVVACDALRPDRDDGALGGEQLRWLADPAADSMRPTIAATHHPPIAILMPVIDAIGLADDDREALASLMGELPAVVGVNGHVHMTALGDSARSRSSPVRAPGVTDRF